MLMISSLQYSESFIWKASAENLSHEFTQKCLVRFLVLMPSSPQHSFKKHAVEIYHSHAVHNSPSYPIASPDFENMRRVSKGPPFAMTKEQMW